MAKRERPAPLSVHATDLDRIWHLGHEDRHGAGRSSADPAADLGWWLTGRGDGAGLTSDDGGAAAGSRPGDMEPTPASVTPGGPPDVRELPT